MRRFKFAASLAAGRELAAALAARLVEDDVVAEVDFLVPVPLHVERLRQRGFDQAAVLAADVSELIGIPVHAALQRTRATAAQSSVVDISTRRRNVRDAFRVVRHVTGARVALVDDVVTTGATASEAARRLRQAGAVEVPVWCCARTPAP